MNTIGTPEIIDNLKHAIAVSAAQLSDTRQRYAFIAGAKGLAENLLINHGLTPTTAKQSVELAHNQAIGVST